MSTDVDRGAGKTAANPISAEARARYEMALAERWMRGDGSDRRRFRRGLAAALIFHVAVLFARLPAWYDEPARVDAPAQQQEMKVQFLKPPPPPKVERKPEPVAKKIPRPDPTPTEPEPEVPPPAPEPPPELVTETAVPSPPVDTGPMRVAPGQGPGLIKRVEPQYPPIAQAARLEGVVVLDAIIDKDGTVREIKVLKSAHAAFEQAAVEALKQWRYTPGPQDVILTVTVSFTLRR